MAQIKQLLLLLVIMAYVSTVHSEIIIPNTIKDMEEVLIEDNRDIIVLSFLNNRARQEVGKI